jgi:hypothetical protein
MIHLLDGCDVAGYSDNESWCGEVNPVRYTTSPAFTTCRDCLEAAAEFGRVCQQIIDAAEHER